MDAVEELARKAGCKLTVCPQAENRNDRWIQVPRPPGHAQPERHAEGRGWPVPTGRGLGLAATGDILEDLHAAIVLPRALLFLIPDLELTPSLQNFLKTRHGDLTPIHPQDLG